jgi:hypothetical protein
MKKNTLSIPVFLALFICASFTLITGCIAPREINQSACLDPEYLRLKAIPTDSMTQRQFEYYQTKDKECEAAYVGANAVHQEQVGAQENIFLGIGLVAVFLIIVYLSSSVSISL